jgi:threonine dehydrogenase-like Zn-dependent dehydrogenase
VKALVKTGRGDGLVSLMEMPEPQPGPGEVKIEIAACGVCGTDLHIWHDKSPYWPPVILGHEFAGTVVKLGPGCSLVEPGARVVAEPHAGTCGHCYYCRTGNSQYCTEKRSPGWGIHGGMARYICYPERLLHRVPDSMSWVQAAMVEPTANAVHNVVERAAVAAGETVVIVGPGPIGLLCAMAARSAGAANVVIVGSARAARTRFPLAWELGFTNLVDTESGDAAHLVHELTNGLGADLVVECSGSPEAIPLIVSLLRKRGRISAVGFTGRRPVTLDWDAFARSAAEIYFGVSTSYTCWDTSIRLITGSDAAAPRIEAERLVTMQAPLEEWEAVFGALERREQMKAVFVPREGT